MSIIGWEGSVEGPSNHVHRAEARLSEPPTPRSRSVCCSLLLVQAGLTLVMNAALLDRIYTWYDAHEWGYFAAIVAYGLHPAGVVRVLALSLGFNIANYACVAALFPSRARLGRGLIAVSASALITVTFFQLCSWDVVSMIERMTGHYIQFPAQTWMQTVQEWGMGWLRFLPIHVGYTSAALAWALRKC